MASIYPKPGAQAGAVVADASAGELARFRDARDALKTALAIFVCAPRWQAAG